tara:strand:- start:1953 stop:3386 length:1434 start_codon:yes stop_codon:yes gene_type:complete
MGYGYLALAVKSQHDNYLIGNPQFTYFKAVYKRHTNFAVDFQEVGFSQNTEDCWGKKIYIQVPKNGDLLHRAYLCIDLDMDGNAGELNYNDLSNWDASGWSKGNSGSANNYAPFAYNLLQYIDLYIGDQLIDRHYSEWLHIWHSVCEGPERSLALAKMIQVNTTETGKRRLAIPLRFWFNTDVGLALPLIALQYADVKFEIKFNKKTDVDRLSSADVSSAIKITNVKLLLENIYLDEDERRAFSSGKHEYLITQVQSSLDNRIKNLPVLWASSKFDSIRHKIPLRFRYPVKELFWTIQDKEGIHVPAYNALGYGDFTNTGCFKYNYWNNYRPGQEQMSYCNLSLNNKELMDELPASFYRNLQRYQYHSGTGVDHVDLFEQRINNPAINYQDYSKGCGVYSYSFSLYPERTQPSGSLNFSKLENARLTFGLTKGKNWGYKTVADSNDSTNTNKTVSIYALNYNVLRIMSGLAGLVFTN